MGAVVCRCDAQWRVKTFESMKPSYAVEENADQ